jgi:hypothetical protein
MTDEKPFTVLIDSAEQTVPEMDQSIRCPDHPDLEPKMQYGLAGGGIGMYTYCDECGKILSKSQDE